MSVLDKASCSEGAAAGLGPPEASDAGLLMFLASNEARYITGAVIPLDGGAAAKFVVPSIQCGNSGSHSVKCGCSHSQGGRDYWG